jgi:hypothetical protein
MGCGFFLGSSQNFIHLQKKNEPDVYLEYREEKGKLMDVRRTSVLNINEVKRCLYATTKMGDPKLDAKRQKPKMVLPIAPNHSLDDLIHYLETWEPKASFKVIPPAPQGSLGKIIHDPALMKKTKIKKEGKLGFNRSVRRFMNYLAGWFK